MVMPSKCPFCDKTYGDAEEHHCDEREAWEKTLIGQGEAARKALEEFVNVINTEAKKSYETLRKLWITDGKSVPSKDDN